MSLLAEIPGPSRVLTLQTDHQALLSELVSDRVVAVLRSEAILLPTECAKCLVDTGIRCVEFTFTDDDVLASIEAAARGSEAIVGAGTVPDGPAARAAIDAGARFIVTPGLDPAVAEVAIASDVPVLLGALTPSEVTKAVELGAAAVKIFPALTGGPGHVKALLGPFPHVGLVASGGVTPETAPKYLEAGAIAVSASVADAASLRDGDLDAVARGGESLVAAVRQWRQRDSATE